ncbi:MAG: helix-turn-helix domain-containing protein [Beijerinckiaceae bacterium]
MLRGWRQRRRLSQIDLAVDADLSTRHLSFLENGRANPSRDMVIALAESLFLPPGECNQLLAAAGFAPVYAQRALDDPALAAMRHAVEQILKTHEPFPAVAVDRRWTLMAKNNAVPALLAGVAPFLLEPPVNVLRLSLHPAGLAPRIINLAAWADHLFSRLRRDIELTADPALIALRDELAAFRPKGMSRDGHAPNSAAPQPVIPLQFSTPSGILSFMSTTMVFGTPLDVTLSELAVELFFPMDGATANAMRALATTD